MPLRLPRERPELLFCDDSATITISERAFPIDGQPLLLDGQGHVVWPVTDFLRYLRVNGRARATVLQYAYQLLDFWHFLHDSSLCWRKVDDHFLRAWRDYLRDVRGIKDSTFNSNLGALVRFYRHAQQALWVTDIIGVNELEKGLFFPIALAPTDDSRGGYESVLSVKTTDKSDDYFPPVSTIDEIMAEVAVRKKPALAERDLLIFEFMRGPGLRRSEVARIGRKQIPSLDEIDAFEDKQLATEHADEAIALLGYPIKIISAKSGGREDIIYPAPALLRRVRQWLDGDRALIVSNKRSKGRLAANPSALFISFKTGAALRPQSITNFFKLAAHEAQEAAVARGEYSPRHADAHPHELRAEAITRFLADLLEAGMQREVALFRAKIFARHANFETTEGYLRFAELLLASSVAAAREASQRSNARVLSRSETSPTKLQGPTLPQFSINNAVERLCRMLTEGRISGTDIDRFLSTLPR